MAGAFVGILVGGALSSIATAIDNEANFSPGVPPAEGHETRDAIVGGLLYGAFGAGIGALIDRAHTHFDRTVAIFGTRANVAPAITPRGVGLRGVIQW
jgi:hypothetical protein